MNAWLRALARGIGLTIAARRDGLPTKGLAKALAAHVRGRRQLSLFREDEVLAERRLDDLVAKHEPKRDVPGPVDRAAGENPPIG